MVLVTAPMIPVGAWLLTGGLRPGAPAGVARLGSLLVCGVFVVLGLALLAGGIGALVDYIEGNYVVNLDDPEGSKRQALIDVGLWAAAATWCFAVAFALLRVRRGLPSRSAGRATS
jgi:hypothetical protein